MLNVRRIAVWGTILMLGLAACAPAEDEALPTVAELPSATPSSTATETPLPPTATPTEPATATSTFTPQPSETPVPSETPTITTTPTSQPSATSPVVATRNAVSTATADAVERPVISTFTPIPAGVTVVARPTSTGTPEVNADVVITTEQLQEELDRLIAQNTTLATLNAEITDEGVDLLITAPDDSGTLTTGRVLVTFEISIVGTNNVLLAQPVQPDLFRMLGGAPVSDAFIQAAYDDAVPALFEAFDFILNQRLGQGQHDLENIVFINNTMAITLVVPLSN
jgi:hypothetical protein